MEAGEKSTLLLEIERRQSYAPIGSAVVQSVGSSRGPRRFAPLFSPTGFSGSICGLLTHYGQWVQPPRRRRNGPGTQAARIDTDQLI